MKILSVIDASGTIINRVVFDDAATWSPPEKCTTIEEAFPMEIGATYLSGVYAPAPTLPSTLQPILSPISDRQFFQQLAIIGAISKDEALEAVKIGTLPAALQKLVDGIPTEEQKFGAKMILSGATTYYRDHPLTLAFGQAYGWTSAQIDAFFAAAAAL